LQESQLAEFEALKRSLVGTGVIPNSGGANPPSEAALPEGRQASDPPRRGADEELLADSRRTRRRIDPLVPAEAPPFGQSQILGGASEVVADRDPRADGADGAAVGGGSLEGPADGEVDHEANAVAEQTASEPEEEAADGQADEVEKKVAPTE